MEGDEGAVAVEKDKKPRVKRTLGDRIAAEQKKIDFYSEKRGAAVARKKKLVDEQRAIGQAMVDEASKFEDAVA